MNGFVVCLDGRMSPFEFKDWVLSIYYAVDVDMLDETRYTIPFIHDAVEYQNIIS